jgi:ppGpp synthetase/RelA/SpoT-type nucleotidyltranferase
MNIEHVIEKYISNQKVLNKVKNSLVNNVNELLNGYQNIDSISGRVKTIESFKVKAFKLLDTGEPKYSDPLIQIQDQIGIRVVVFYKPNVSTVREVILNYFSNIESKTIIPDEDDKFGYEATHLILAIPDDYRDIELGVEECPEFFEFQIHTLFQHAWAQANHNLQYKPSTKLNKTQERKISFTAAQAWGADRMFEELLDELGEN